MWVHSLAPSDFSATGAQTVDFGNGRTGPMAHVHAATSTSVADLVPDRTRRADVSVDLVARSQRLTVGGQTIDGYTLNGTSPGPQITVRQGQLVQVRLHNESVPAGVTLHWHGIDVPNAMDGVAGITQDAVPVGGDFVYRFVAEKAGSYWYHSHQLSSVQVTGGLVGSINVLPEHPPGAILDVTALAHTYAGVRTLNGTPGDLQLAARPGQPIRVRVVNTDNASVLAWASAPYTVTAVDGWDVHGPTPVSDRSLLVTAGGRADLQLTTPEDGSGVRVQIGKATAVVVGGTDGSDGVVVAPPAQPADQLDLLTYGDRAPLGFDPARADRRFDYVVRRRPGFVLGKPGVWWSINGALYPNIAMPVVSRNDVVVIHIDNKSNEPHPFHLHGHHAVVLARNGVPATGAPWWFDSLEVPVGTTFDISFVANNPGVWMDHCHNLQHAADGMVVHLMYDDVSEPYRIGGTAGNQPE
ncbi:MAG: multicopper oxidase family protein [Propionibacteriaceae bacterium]